MQNDIYSSKFFRLTEFVIMNNYFVHLVIYHEMWVAAQMQAYKKEVLRS